MNDPRDSLPDVRDEDNPIVWCERCKKQHRLYTFTRQNFDQIVDQLSKSLANAIDAHIEDELFGLTYKPE